MDERMDLTALELDDIQRELMIAAIMARTAPGLARRAADVSPMQVLSGWARPALAAAALLAVVCMPVLVSARHYHDPGAGLTDELAVPAPADAWLTSERAPTVGDVLVAMEQEGEW